MLKNTIIYKIVILPVVLYREEHRLMVFENRMLARIFTLRGKK
jgi:hypothetical protein